MTSSRGRTVAVLAATALVVLCLFAGFFGDESWWWAFGWLAFPIVGAALLIKRPGHRIGWLLWLAGAGWAVSWLGYQFSGPPLGTAPPWAELLAGLGGYLAWVALIAIVVLFPSGHAQSRVGRILVQLVTAVGVLIVLAVVLNPGPLEASRRPNPFGVASLGWATDWYINQGFVLVPLLMLAALISLAARWRRSEGVERRQYQWLGWSVAFAVSLIAASNYIGGDEAEAAGAVQLSDLVFLVGPNAVPIAIGVAVLRYRLYEIDRIVSRTVSYVVVVGVLGGVYAAMVAVTTWLLPVSSDVAVAIGVLVAAAVFRPVYVRVKTVVDRRFNRERYDAERTVEAFGERLRSETAPDVASADLLAVVGRTVQPSTLGLWVRSADE